MGTKTIGVVGAGIMGSGIAQVAAVSGLDVVIADVDEKLARAAVDRIGAALGKLVEKQKIAAADRDGALRRLRAGASIEEMAKVDLVVEAATENEEVKLGLFERLDKLCAPGVVIASNTSSISITRLAAATRRPSRVIGMHFMNPVPVMKLVEVVRGLATSQETVDEVGALAVKLGKSVVVTKDMPGFVVNRILMPMVNEGVFALMEGLGTPDEIDTAMKLGTNQPMGPLALADLIGLDTCVAILDVLHRGLGDPKYRACPLLRQYVAAGWLGRKTGRGFHNYEVA